MRTFQYDYSTWNNGRKSRNQVLTRLKASNNVPRTAIVRVNLRYGIALLIPKILLQNLLRNPRLLSSELTIMTMPSTAGKVQTSILMIRIKKPIFKSGIKNLLDTDGDERDSRKNQLKLQLTVEHAPCIHSLAKNAAIVKYLLFYINN